MSSRKKRKNLAAVVISFSLFTALLSGFFCETRRPHSEEWSKTLNGHRFPVKALAFSSDGATLISAAYHLGDLGGRMEVIGWDVETRSHQVIRIADLGELLSLACAPGGQTLAYSLKDQTLWLWDLPCESEELCVHESGLFDLAFSKDGCLLAAADNQSNIVVWDVGAGRKKSSTKVSKLPIFTLAFAPDGLSLAVGGSDRLVRIWDVATGKERNVLKGHNSPVLAVRYTPDGRTLVSGDFNGYMKIWDMPVGIERAELPQYKEEITALSVSPDGRTLAVASGTNVELWDVAKATRIARLSEHERKVSCLAFSPDGTLLASGSYDKTVRLWKVAR